MLPGLRFPAAALLVLSLLAAAGCGGKPAAPAGPAPAPQPQPPTQAAPAPAPKPAPPPARVVVGALKLTSSAPVFIALEKGFWKDENLEIELKWFEAAAPVAVAVASGDLDVGATGITAALYNMVAEGQPIKVVADKGREWPGNNLGGLVIRKDLYDQGVKSVRDLKGRSVAITQIGSTYHYVIGTMLEKEGLSLKDVQIKPLQSLSAMMQAMESRQVDAMIMSQPNAGVAEAKGIGKLVLATGDVVPYQSAAIFYSGKFAANRDVAVRFMKGYIKALRYYYDAAFDKDGKFKPGASYDGVVNITARYTGAAADVIKRSGLTYMDRDGKVMEGSIARQIQWYLKEGQIKKAPRPEDVEDPSFVQAALKELGGN